MTDFVKFTTKDGNSLIVSRESIQSCYVMDATGEVRLKTNTAIWQIQETVDDVFDQLSKQDSREDCCKCNCKQ